MSTNEKKKKPKTKQATTRYSDHGGRGEWKERLLGNCEDFHMHEFTGTFPSTEPENFVGWAAGKSERIWGLHRMLKEKG